MITGLPRVRQFLRVSAIVLVAALAPAKGRVEASGEIRLTPDPTGVQLLSADGRRTMTAAQVQGSITLDGSLDEEAWRHAEPAGAFLQAEPHEGQPATELTIGRAHV